MRLSYNLRRKEPTSALAWLYPYGYMWHVYQIEQTEVFSKRLAGLRDARLRRSARDLPHDSHRDVSLWRRSHSRPAGAENADELQLLHLPALRGPVGLLRRRLGPCRSSTRRSRQIFLETEGSRLLPLPAVRMRHALPVPQDRSRIPGCSECRELRACRAARRPDSQARRRENLDLEVPAAAVFAVVRPDHAIQPCLTWRTSSTISRS